jgi:superfamily I DNA and/or RNA helicase
MEIKIDKRYRIDNFDDHIAIDTQDNEENCVEIFCFKTPKHDNLIHNTFLNRAKDFSRLRHDRMTPLLDYGYDSQNQCYYLVYEYPFGKSLKKILNHPRRSIEWIVQLILIVLEVLYYLESKNYIFGTILLDDLILDSGYNLPVVLKSPGIIEFRILLGLEDLVEDPLTYDLDEILSLFKKLITWKERPSNNEFVDELAQFPEEIREILTYLELEKTRPYSSLIQLRKHLEEFISNYTQTDTYYLEITKNVKSRLVEFGFIENDYDQLVKKFLQEEFSNKVYVVKRASIEKDNEDQLSFVTNRFRFPFVKDYENPNQKLVLKTIECPQSIYLMNDRESGCLTKAKYKLGMGRDFANSSSVEPFITSINEFFLKLSTTKNKELDKKDSLTIWKKVLEIQKRLLYEFQLSYSNWDYDELNQNLIIELTSEIDEIDLTEEERLLMTSKSGKGLVFAGFFEELTGKELKIGIGKDTKIEKISKNGKIYLDQQQIMSILARQEEAFNRLRYNESTNPNLLNLLTNPEKLELDIPQKISFWDQDLDEFQKEAVNKVLSSRDIFLIQGPPGTGKTRTIVEITRQLLNDEKNKTDKILISSQSNVAVNHALSLLLEKEKSIKDSVVRIGREEKAENTSDLLIEQQVMRWAKEVIAKSNSYFTEINNQSKISEELRYCFDCIEKFDTINNKRRTEEEDLKIKLNNKEEIIRKYHAVNQLLSEFKELKAKVTQIQDISNKNDSDFEFITNFFENEVITWSKEFLEKATQLSQISQLKVEIENKIENINEKLKEYNSEQEKLISSISIILQEKYNQQIIDIEKQRSFIEKLLSNQKDLIYKLNKLKKINEDWQRRIGKGLIEFSGVYINRCKVVGATCIGIAAKGDIRNIEFDWVIIDEAGRATHPELLVPMVRGKKIILVGDHKQLPPILDKDLDGKVLEEIQVKREELETSLFYEMISSQHNSSYSLRKQYRMDPAIGNMISKCFYDNKLEHGENVLKYDNLQHWCNSPVLWLSTSKSSKRFEKRVGYSYNNTYEVDIIIKILNKLNTSLVNFKGSKSVGIIAGYMAQKHLFSQRINKNIIDNIPHCNISINTVDAFQGKEMDYIIYSVVRSNKEKKIGFLRDARRLNVALSRAKEFLIIVGDHEMAKFAKVGVGNNPFFDVIDYIENDNSCDLIRSESL